jgi:hypothetical protein
MTHLAMLEVDHDGNAANRVSRPNASCNRPSAPWNTPSTAEVTPRTIPGAAAGAWGARSCATTTFTGLGV